MRPRLESARCLGKCLPLLTIKSGGEMVIVEAVIVETVIVEAVIMEAVIVEAVIVEKVIMEAVIMHLNPPFHCWASRCKVCVHMDHS